DRGGYEGRILARIADEVAPHDPEGVLRGEWMNARGAIARFDRGSIEIRLLDVQECPRADLAIADAVVGALRALVSGRLVGGVAGGRSPHKPLAEVLEATAAEGDLAPIRDAGYLGLLGWQGRVPCRANELWRDLVRRTREEREGGDEAALGRILDE